MKKKYISILTQNNIGVLHKISGLVRRKLFNISSVSVGETSNKHRSRFIITTQGSEREAEQIAQAIGKLIEVIEIKILDTEKVVVRQLVLTRIEVGSETKEKLVETLQSKCLIEVIGYQNNILCLEIGDDPGRIEEAMQYLLSQDIEIIQWIPGGIIAIENESTS